MNRTFTLTAFVICMLTGFLSWGQGQSQNNRYSLSGTEPVTINVNQSFTTTTEITPFANNVNRITGLAISAVITLDNVETSEVKIILVDKNYEEHLVYETNYLLESGRFSVDKSCEETCILDHVRVGSVIIEVTDATVELQSLTYTRAIGQGINIEKEKRDKKLAQMDDKINRINKSLKERGRSWIAGPTEIGEMTFAERKLLFGQSTFPAGFEFYAGGVITAGDDSETIGLKSATASQYVDDWDWRNRHGRNWITPVANQSSCGSCWAFSAAAATEAMVNLFFNQLLNLNLSEQELLSCTSGTCSGGYPGTALNYIASNGIVDEKTFPYVNSAVSCSNKGNSPSELIKIGGKVDFGSGTWSKTEDNLKKMLIHMGPVSGGLTDWSHAMALVGYKVVKEGDKFFYRDMSKSRYWKTVAAGDPLIGKTVWIFKNSWGTNFGDQGYVYVETAISNMNWTHAIKPSITSLVNTYKVICEDKDGDGYYWWGLGPKPADCDCPDTPDGDDSDPTRGPIDAYGNFILLSNPPVANFSADKTKITEGETVQFTDLSTANTLSWSWTFEGGNPLSSTIKNPAVKYTKAGSYRVSLTATGKDGSHTKTVEKYITVEAPAPVLPVADFTADRTKVKVGESVQFTDLSTSNTLSWSWSFDGGNPSSSTLKNPAVKYAVAGSYRVSLTATGKDGSHTKTVDKYITVEALVPPVADFTADRTKVKEGESVQFTDLSTSNTLSWSWTFEGGNPSASTLKNPAVKYPVAGSYRVTLTATGNDGNHTKTVDGYITVETIVVEPLVAGFTSTGTNVEVGGQVQFFDTSTGSPTGWQWSFPGGTPSVSTDRNPVVTYANAGQFDVSLIVSKGMPASVELVRENYIRVTEISVLDYCIPVSLNSSQDYISYVSMGIGMGSPKAATGFSLIEDLIYLMPGKRYSVTLVPGQASTRNFWRIWIDFNGDGDFNDTGELIVVQNNKKGSIRTNMLIPSYASGTKRMRVAMRNGSSPDPCDDNYNGEVQDFMVDFTAPSSTEFITSVEALKESIKLTCYPNPVSDILKLRIGNFEADAKYNLYNLNGSTITAGHIRSAEAEIDLSGFPQGMYILKVVSGQATFSEKVIKK